MKKKSKRMYQSIYVRMLRFTCAHPDCKSGLGIDAHHIRPLSKGGDDAFWNLISLCTACHHKRKLHSHAESYIVELYVYKSMHESNILGFYMDEQRENFKSNLNKAMREDRGFADDEKFIYSNMLDEKN